MCMCVCVYVCMCVVAGHDVYVCMYVYVHVYVYAYVYVYVYVFCTNQAVYLMSVYIRHAHTQNVCICMFTAQSNAYSTHVPTGLVMPILVGTYSFTEEERCGGGDWSVASTAVFEDAASEGTCIRA